MRKGIEASAETRIREVNQTVRGEGGEFLSRNGASALVLSLDTARKTVWRGKVQAMSTPHVR